MSLRQLPIVDITAFDALRDLDTGLEPDALARWNVAARALETGADNVISIYDRIGEDFEGRGVTDKLVAALLRRIGARDVVVNINSPGGIFYQGLAIYNLLRAHPHKVHVNIIGAAASAASFIAMAGDQIEIARASFMMIHNAQGIAIGNRHDLAEAIDMLAGFDKIMADIYASRTGIPAAEIAAMLDKETYFDGEQAVASKFADALLPADRVAEDAEASASAAPVLAVRRIDAALARQGMSKGQRRELIKEFRSGKSGAAAPSAMHDAGDIALAAEMRRAISTFSM